MSSDNKCSEPSQPLRNYPDWQFKQDENETSFSRLYQPPAHSNQSPAINNYESVKSCFDPRQGNPDEVLLLLSLTVNMTHTPIHIKKDIADQVSQKLSHKLNYKQKIQNFSKLHEILKTVRLMLVKEDVTDNKSNRLFTDWKQNIFNHMQLLSNIDYLSHDVSSANAWKSFEELSRQDKGQMLNFLKKAELCLDTWVNYTKITNFVKKDICNKRKRIRPDHLSVFPTDSLAASSKLPPKSTSPISDLLTSNEAKQYITATLRFLTQRLTSKSEQEKQNAEKPNGKKRKHEAISPRTDHESKAHFALIFTYLYGLENLVKNLIFRDNVSFFQLIAPDTIRALHDLVRSIQSYIQTLKCLSVFHNEIASEAKEIDQLAEKILQKNEGFSCGLLFDDDLISYSHKVCCFIVKITAAEKQELPPKKRRKKGSSRSIR